MENNLEEIIVPKLKRIRIPGRKRGPGKKPFEEKISLQPEYSLNYHHAKRAIEIVCPNCGRTTTRGKLHRHIKTLYCFRHTKDPGEIEQIQKAFEESKHQQCDVSNLCLLAPC